MPDFYGSNEPDAKQVMVDDDEEADELPFDKENPAIDDEKPEVEDKK